MTGVLFRFIFAACALFQLGRSVWDARHHRNGEAAGRIVAAFLLAGMSGAS